MVISQGSKATCASIPNIINGPYTEKMVDLSVLAPYGIGVLEGEAQPSGGRSLLAYVPLNLAPDATGGGRTAFQARMLYWPGSDNNAWTQAQQVRVMWAVQVLTDACEEEGFPLDEKYAEEDPEDYDKQLKTWCTTHRTMDEPQVVQRYDESWYMTGLNVREDHGLDVAIAYLQPGKYTDQHHPPDDEDLWSLSWGLGQMFVPGRDCETDADAAERQRSRYVHTDSYRDLAVFENNSANSRIGNTTIAGRFDGADKNRNGTPDNEEYANAKGWADAAPGRSALEHPGQCALRRYRALSASGLSLLHVIHRDPAHPAAVPALGQSYAAVCARGTLSQRRHGCGQPGERRADGQHRSKGSTRKRRSPA